MSRSPSPDGIARAVKAVKGDKLPPVESWNPPFCGDIDMRIARDGTWYHEGSPIGRKPLVRLFSSILRREGDRYFLVTPVEKLGITVEDAPFVAVDFDVENPGPDQILRFHTHVGDCIAAGRSHPIRVVLDPQSAEPAPYVLVRRNLEALIDRKSFYRLVELGAVQMQGDTAWFGVLSGGTFFPIAPAEDLEA